jgi:hypothetical protein
MTPKDEEASRKGMQETDIDALSIPEEKTGTKVHSGAFPPN